MSHVCMKMKRVGLSGYHFDPPDLVIDSHIKFLKKMHIYLFLFMNKCYKKVGFLCYNVYIHGIMYHEILIYGLININ